MGDGVLVGVGAMTRRRTRDSGRKRHCPAARRAGADPRAGRQSHAAGQRPQGRSRDPCRGRRASRGRGAQAGCRAVRAQPRPPGLLDNGQRRLSPAPCGLIAREGDIAHIISSAGRSELRSAQWAGNPRLMRANRQLTARISMWAIRNAVGADVRRPRRWPHAQVMMQAMRETTRDRAHTTGAAGDYTQTR